MAFDFAWASAFDKTVKAMMRAIIDEFPNGKVADWWLDDDTGGSVNGRKALGRILREAVKRGVVSVDARQAQNLAHHGSAGHDDTPRDLLNASSASDEPVELYSRDEICKVLRSSGFVGDGDYKRLFEAFGWQ